MRFFSKAGISRRNLLWLLLIWLVATAANLFKAYHIDDTAYLLMARWTAGHPLHPMSGLLNWEGVDRPIFKLLHPQLFIYVLAGWISVFGYSEPATHSLQSLLVLTCILGFYRLAKHLIPSAAVWLTAIFTLGPAFVVEQNLMLDIPLLACWLIFFNALVLGIYSGKQNVRFAVIALAVSAGILIKYSSLILLPILVLAILLEKRWKQWWAPVFPIFVFGAWCLFNVYDFGHVHILGARGSSNRPAHLTLRFAVDWVLAFGSLNTLGALALAQSSSLLRRHQKYVYICHAAICIALVAIIASGHIPETAGDRLLQPFFALNALFCGIPLWQKLVDVLHRKKSQISILQFYYLYLWIALSSIFYVVTAPSIAARHVLTILAPVLLLSALYWKGFLTTASKSYALVFTVLLSTALCISDWRFADFNRKEALNFTVKPLYVEARRSGHTVWTNEHWGWQWYSEPMGVREIDYTSRSIGPGDLLVTETPLTQPLQNQTNLRFQLEEVESMHKPMLQLFCTARPARFYSVSGRGTWYLNPDCLEKLYFYKVLPS